MAPSQIREELHDFINKADERMLNLLYEMVQSDSGFLSKEQQEDLDRRINNHKAGRSASHSWPDVRARIEKRA
jgi:putative addiction module component (TIGR02574 family)